MQRDRIVAIYMRFIKAVMWLISAIVGWVRVSGLENLPDTGPYIIVTNHLSVIDVAVVLLAFPTQQMRVFAADKWRHNPVTGLLLGLSGAIWVRRGEVDRRALRIAIEALQNGEILGMAPEGTRSKDGILHKARQGPAYLASLSGAPLVPVGIINSDKFAANIRKLRRTDLRAYIGPSFKLPACDGRPRAKELESYSELIMVHIANLLPERYHGFYTDSPGLVAIRAGADPWPAIEAERSASQES
jgi:1-acyl-sn-glycerol-3-phosphate acyltransferase